MSCIRIFPSFWTSFGVGITTKWWFLKQIYAVVQNCFYLHSRNDCYNRYKMNTVRILHTL